ncbi:MAG: hypothetical protein HY868_24175 [Chloroflexi bacterium]|nr:hypothetical protein [Chloroflexota bacterium]
MNQELADNLIEIHDPEINTAEIMEQIRERIRRRRKELGYEKRVFPSFGGTAFPGEPDDIGYDPNLYHHLRLANETFANVETGAQLPATRATRIPIFGSVWQRARAYLHRIVLFYVNRSIEHQVNVNRHLISALNQLTALSQTQQRQIMALEAELKQLRSQKD